MWNSGSHVSFQRFVNSLYGKPEEKYLAVFYQTMMPPVPEFWSLTFFFRKNPYETLLPHKDNNMCSCMLLRNLAEPDWIIIPCDQEILADTICTVSQIDKHPQYNSCHSGLDEFCEKGQISSGNICLHFSWNISNEKMLQGIPKKSIFYTECHVPHPVGQGCRELSHSHIFSSTQSMGQGSYFYFQQLENKFCSQN